MFGERVDDATDVGPVDGPRAHTARLGTGVESRSGQTLGRKTFCRAAGGEQFRMLRGIAFGRARLVMRFNQDLPILIYDHSREWMLTGLAGFASQGNAAAQVKQIVFG